MLKRTGTTEDFDAKKIQHSLQQAGCDIVVAEEIAVTAPRDSTISIHDYVTDQLIQRGYPTQAIKYKSYRSGFTSNALHVLRQRYFLHDGDGKPSETPHEMFGRVAVCMAMPALGGIEPPTIIHGFEITPFHTIPYRGKSWKKGDLDSFSETVQQYHDIMMDRRFMPNSPTLMNAGTPLGQLSACFVLDIPDNLPGIMDTVKNTALIFQSGGGVGINYSSLRPAGARVGSTASAASGPISFMKFVDGVSDIIKQGGRRRAANMGILDVRHKDVMKFIMAKHGQALTNFNISVGTDARFWDDVYNGDSGANDTLDQIAASAHRSAEPGVIFFDNINRHNVLERARGKPLRATNPCWGGETKVLTKDGPIPFRDLALGPSQVQVVSREEDGSLSYRVMENPGITAQNVEVVCLVLCSEQTGECTALRCTPTHSVYVIRDMNIQKVEVQNLTPGMSVASLYKDDDIWEQTLGVSVKHDEIREIRLEGTGHPTPGIMPMSLVARKGKKKKKKKRSEGFMTSEGVTPEVQSDKKGGLFNKLFKNHTVLGIIRLGKTDVYNGLVHQTHNYFVQCGEDDYILSGNCGEQALYPNESCNLGSINLAMYVDGDDLDWDYLAEDTRTCTRMLDGVVDMTRHPTPEIGAASNETRRIGLGVMGVADMLMQLGTPYNSAEAYRLFGRIAEWISWYSMDESIQLAKTHGPFPLYGQSAYVDGKLPFAGDDYTYLDWEHRSALNWDALRQDITRHGIRNVLTTTIAPTGTISMIAGCSSGIEPVFSLAYTKTVSVGTFHYGCPVLALKHPDIIQQVAANGGVIIPGMIPDSDVYCTARQIHWADHVLAQAAWQRWMGNSISKTINMAANCTVRDVRDAYVLAHSLGCRGITVYRDTSRDVQVLESSGVQYDDPMPSDVAKRYLA